MQKRPRSPRRWDGAQWAVLLMLAVGVVIVPFALDRFVFGKLLVAAVAVALAWSSTATGRLPRTVVWLLSAACVILLVSALASTSPGTALLGRAPRYEGVFVLGLYTLCGISGPRLLGPGRTERTSRLALQTMAVSILLIGVVAALETMGLRPLSSDIDRPGSLLGNASDEGALAVLYAGPLFVAALRKRDPLMIVGAVGALATVALSASRGALVGLAVVLVVVALSAGGRTRATALGSLALAAVAAFALPATRSRILDQSPLSAATVNGRSLLWRESLHLLGRHLPLGVGPSQYENAIVAEHDRQWQTTVGPQDPPGSPHNLILQVLSAGGVVLLIVVVWLAVLGLRRALAAIRSEDSGWTLGIVAGLAGFGAALMFHLTSPGTTIPAALLAGSLLAEPLVRAKTTRPVSPPLRVTAAHWAAVGAAALLALVFAAASIAEIALRSANEDVANGNLASANSAFTLARALRPWDPDLPAQAMHAFVDAAGAGGVTRPDAPTAIAYAQQWERRSSAVKDDEQVVDNRAALLDLAGDDRGAATLLDGALRRDPYDPQLLLLRGVVAAKLDDNATAIRTLLLATEIDKTDPQGWQDLAVVYQRTGDTAKAAAATQRSKQLSH